MFHVCKALEKGSPELRDEALKWVLSRIDSIKDIPDKKDVCFSLC
jgi:hypothetical protein